MTEHRDRILDWRQELRRLEPDIHALPRAARDAVLSTVARFLWEDAKSLPAPGRVDEAA